MYKLALIALARGDIDASAVQLQRVSQSSDNPLSAEADALTTVIKLLNLKEKQEDNSRGKGIDNVERDDKSNGGEE